jgi:hypothetical protein
VLESSALRVEIYFAVAFVSSSAAFASAKLSNGRASFRFIWASTSAPSMLSSFFDPA